MDDFFAYFFLLLIVIGGLWSIHNRERKLARYVEIHGWKVVRKNVRDSLVRFAYLIAIYLAFTFYICGVVVIPLYFDSLTRNVDTVYLFVSIYFAVGLAIWYFVSGVKRRKTKNIKIILSQDFHYLVNVFENFLNELTDIFNGLLSITGWLLKVFMWVVLVGLCIWIIVALGPLWIIAIVLILILVALINR